MGIIAIFMNIIPNRQLHPMLWKGFAIKREFANKHHHRQKLQIKRACLLQFNLSITIFQRRFQPIKILVCNSVNSSIKSFRFSETATSQRRGNSIRPANLLPHWNTRPKCTIMMNGNQWQGMRFLFVRVHQV